MVRIEIRNIDKLQGYLRSVQQVTQDLRPFWRDKETPELKKQARQVFDAEGPGWAPLSTSYVKRYPGRKILEGTGSLRRSYTDNPFVRYERQEMDYGSSSPGARIHELGGRHIPKRSVLEPLAQLNRQTVGPIFNDWLRDQYGQRRRRFGFGN